MITVFMPTVEPDHGLSSFMPKGERVSLDLPSRTPPVAGGSRFTLSIRKPLAARRA
jgi:hypothetical protein